MKSNRLHYVALCVLIIGICLPTTNALQTLKKRQLTNLTNATYDRNPSFFEASDGTYWLFFARSTTGTSGGGTPAARTSDTCGDYQLCFMTSTDKGATWTAPDCTQLAVPAHDQYSLTAFQHPPSGDIFVFYYDWGGTASTYYFRYRAGAWTTAAGVSVFAFAGGKHLTAWENGAGNIGIGYELGGVGIRYRWVAYAPGDPLAGWSGVLPMPDMGAGSGIPKAMIDASVILHVVFIGPGWAPGNGVFESTYDWSIPAWAGPTLIVNSGPLGLTDCDPVLFQDSVGDYWLFWAPWDPATDTQWIESLTSSDGVTWSGRTQWTTSATAFWDYWPQIHEKIPGELLMFYTSEASGEGAIWMMSIGTPVGGVWTPIDTFGLLAPWIGLASLVTAAAVSVAIVKRRKKE